MICDARINDFVRYSDIHLLTRVTNFYPAITASTFAFYYLGDDIKKVNVFSCKKHLL